MLTTTAKRTPSRNSTAAIRSAKHSNGTAAQSNGKRSGRLVAPQPAIDAKSAEPPPPSEFDTFAANFRAEKNAKLQQNQATDTAPNALPDAGRLEEVATQLRNSLNGAAASSKPAPPPQPALPPAPPGTFLKECFPTAMVVVMLNQTLGREINPASVQIFFDNMMEEIGVADDPLDRALAEQVTYLRIVSGDLHSRTVLSTKSAEASAYNTAACTAAAELRRAVRDLKDRQKNAGPSRSKSEAKVNSTDKAAAAGRP